MKKVYLVIQVIPRGFAEDEVSYKVYNDKFEAEKAAKKVYGFVKELEYVCD